MPSESKAQARLARMAKHNPGKVYKRNQSILKMKGVDLSEFASTPEKGLPYKKKKRNRKRG